MSPVNGKTRVPERLAWDDGELDIRPAEGQRAEGKARRARRSVAAVIDDLRVLRARLSGALRDELDGIIDSLAGVAKKHGNHDQSSHGRRRSGVLGSVMDDLASLREKLSDDDRSVLDKAMAKLRNLESSDVDDDDLIEDEPDEEDGEEDDDEEEEIAVGEYLAVNSSQYHDFTLFLGDDREVNFDYDGDGFSMPVQEAVEVRDMLRHVIRTASRDQEHHDSTANFELTMRPGEVDTLTGRPGTPYEGAELQLEPPYGDHIGDIAELLSSLNDIVDLAEREGMLPNAAGKSASKGASMATKSFNPTIKAVGDAGEGTATFRIASYNEVDKDGDVTVPGFFGKQPVQMVPVHDWNHVPIGKGKIYEKPDGVYCDVKFNLKIPAARDWYEHIKFDMEHGPALQEYCADEETEILTRRGWLRFDELTTDDQAFTLDVTTGTAKFEDVLAVNIFPREKRMLRRIETGGFSSLTTKDHRWPVRFRDDGRVGWRTTEKLATSNGIFRSAPRVDAPIEAKWSDAFVELVAWFWNEGWRERGRNVNIGQSMKVNPQKVAAIRGALSVAFPGEWTENTDRHGMTRFRMRLDASRALMDVVSENKAPHPEFLMSLTTAQLRLFIERCLDGDGTRHASGTRLWYQCDPDSIGTFEMACALAGQPTASHCEMKVNEARHGLRPRRTVSLLRSPVATPLASISVKRYNSKPRRTVAVDEWVSYEGHVWCPTTPSGTWLARRRGSVYFTGNSYGYEVLPGGSKAGQHQGKQVRFLIPRDDGTPGVKVFEVSPVLQGAGTGTRTVSVKGRSMRINRAGGSGVTSASRAVKGAIPSHETKTVSRAWDRVRTENALPDDARPSELRTVYAWVDPDGDPELKASYSWPHHHGIGGPANLRACLMGIASLNGPAGADMGDAERKGIYDHLAGHLKDADREPPALRDRGTGPTKQYDELSEGLAIISGLIDGAYSGAALRREKGRGLSGAKAELLTWMADDLTRLKSLLSNPVEPETPQPDDDEVASVIAMSIALINGITPA